MKGSQKTGGTGDSHFLFSFEYCESFCCQYGILIQRGIDHCSDILSSYYRALFRTLPKMGAWNLSFQHVSTEKNPLETKKFSGFDFLGRVLGSGIAVMMSW